MSTVVKRYIKILVFSCLGMTVIGILMFSGWTFVAVKLIGISQKNDENVKSLPEVTGRLNAADTFFISPIGKKPASLVMLFTICRKKGISTRGTGQRSFNTLIFPKKLMFRVGDKDYQVQSPEKLIYLNQRAKMYFPAMQKSGDSFELKPKGEILPTMIADQEIPQGLVGHNSLLDCILHDFPLGKGSCAETYSYVLVAEYYYTQGQTVTLKGKIEGDKFLLMDLTSAK